jgi:hypothetical protein
MSQKIPSRVSPPAVVLILLGVATAVKTLWASTSVGTCDSMLFFYFAKSIHRWGMVHLYEGTTIFNHTPLTGGLIQLLYLATNGYYLHFAAILRLICVVADVALVLGLLHVRKLTGQPPWWALGLFAISPVSIMVSGFHGNIDPIMVMFLFFAAVAVLTDRPILCGVMFAAACNIKIVPILVSPVFIFYWIARGRRPAAAFMGTSGALMLAGAAWGLIYCPAAFLRNVFGYGSYWGGWGVTYWLRQTGIKAFDLMSFADLTDTQNHVITLLKVVSMAGVLALAWRRRKLGGLDFFTTLGAAFTWIFVFMPGAGVQYMVWFAPSTCSGSTIRPPNTISHGTWPCRRVPRSPTGGRGPISSGALSSPCSPAAALPGFCLKSGSRSPRPRRAPSSSRPENNPFARGGFSLSLPPLAHVHPTHRPEIRLRNPRPSTRQCPR